MPLPKAGASPEASLWGKTIPYSGQSPLSKSFLSMLQAQHVSSEPAEIH